MNIYTFKRNIEQIPLSKKGIQLVLSGRYADTEELKPYIESGDIEVRKLSDIHTQYKGQSLNNKSVMIFRRGGYGDILFATPLVRILRERYPNAKIHFSCSADHHMIWNGNRDISRFGVFDYPITWKKLKNYNYHLHFDRVIEDNPEAEKINAYDLFLKQAGINYKTIPDNKKLPIYSPDTYSLNKVKNFLRYKLGIQPGTDKIIMVQARASVSTRSIDSRVLLEVVVKLGKISGYKVLVTGGMFDVPIKMNIPNVYVIAGMLRMTDSVALMSYSDLVIAPDSSLVHFAAAINVPCVSIYGPFPAELRTKYYPLNISIEPPVPEDSLVNRIRKRLNKPLKDIHKDDVCWPCFSHARYCPKTEGPNFNSPCLDKKKIPSELIYQTALVWLKKHASKKRTFMNKETVVCGVR